MVACLAWSWPAADSQQLDQFLAHIQNTKPISTASAIVIIYEAAALSQNVHQCSVLTSLVTLQIELIPRARAAVCVVATLTQDRARIIAGGQVLRLNRLQIGNAWSEYNL